PKTGPRLEQILSVVPAPWLKGKAATTPGRPAANGVAALVTAAEAEAPPKPPLGAIRHDPDGTWRCTFLTTIDPRVAQVKLDVLWEEGGVSMDARAEGRVVFRKLAPPPQASGLFSAFAKKPKAPDSGLEVVVELADPGRGTAEVEVVGKFFGPVTPEFAKAGEKAIVRLLEGIRRTLDTVADRRKHPRFSAPFMLSLYPLHSDGRVDAPIQGVCRDVSAGGLSLFCPTKPPTKHLYAVFEDAPGVSGLGLMVQVLTAEWQHDEVLVTGRYRLDLGGGG
ncbi:MAG: PilZ domain-containing protein, partial [Gemmataceae bacterium]|nr:PilZ domain-containing protein [Gemmataceae bacterium]